MNVMRWCLPRFGDGNSNNIGLFTWQAQHMSNYLCYLLTKQLDVTTNLEKPEKQFVPRYFHPILNEGENENKRKDIEPHHVKRLYLYGVMMTQMLITILNGRDEVFDVPSEHDIWKINMVGIIQSNQTGAPMAASVKGRQAMKKKTYEYKMWQHKTQPSVAAVWSDNNLVKTLFNYH